MDTGRAVVRLDAGGNAVLDDHLHEIRAGDAIVAKGRDQFSRGRVARCKRCHVCTLTSARKAWRAAKCPVSSVSIRA
jgi:hypothetical protein